MVSVEKVEVEVVVGLDRDLDLVLSRDLDLDLGDTDRQNWSCIFIIIRQQSSGKTSESRNHYLPYIFVIFRFIFGTDYDIYI